MHLLRSTDGDEAVIGRGDDDFDVESQPPAIRNSTGGVRNLFKHLDRRFSLSEASSKLQRLENIRVDRNHHHPSSSSSPLSASVVAGKEDQILIYFDSIERATEQSVANDNTDQTITSD
ncbi:hypothetical protein Bca4012_009960 [Brassica carinata]